MQIRQLSPRALNALHRDVFTRSIPHNPLSLDPREELYDPFERAAERMRKVDPEASEAIALFNEYYRKLQ